MVSVVVGRGLISVVVTSGFVPDITPDIVFVIVADGLTSAADTGGFTCVVLLTFFTASASIPFVSSPSPRPFSATLFERTSLTSFSSSRHSSTSFIYSHKPSPHPPATATAPRLPTTARGSATAAEASTNARNRLRRTLAPPSHATRSERTIRKTPAEREPQTPLVSPPGASATPMARSRSPC